MNVIPLRDRAITQLRKRHLSKAIRTCKQVNGLFLEIRNDFDEAVTDLYRSKAYGTILSGIYEAGEFGPYTVITLLQALADNRDFPTLLKQAYRFNVYAQLRPSIDEALAWHRERNLPDASAWKYKFDKLQEQELLSNPPRDEKVFVVSEDLPDESLAAPKTFDLRPLKVDARIRGQVLLPEDTNDPYIVSRVAKAKMEQANGLHKETLRHLDLYLKRLGRSVFESKLIDAFCELQDGPAIFEIKSINSENEREQIRHALSQLYEYRFLHSMRDASLWIVFSQRPSSDWYVSYLLEDRGVRVTWLEGDRLAGPSIHGLM